MIERRRSKISGWGVYATRPITKNTRIVTYDEEQSRYPHPDHLRVHEISVIAFDAAADPDRYPDLGAPWQPLKLYYSAWSVRRMLAMVDRMIELGIEAPWDDERLEQMRAAAAEPDRTTTSVDICSSVALVPST